MPDVPTFHMEPDVERGVRYWQGVPATVDGVLGGYGNGTLPLVDAQGSRTFLLQVLPRLSTVAPASANQGAEAWLKERIAERGGKGKAKTRALDCGAGVGRVSRDVLTRICDIVHIVEPVESFLREAKNTSSSWPAMKLPPSKTPFEARKVVHFHLSTLQTFDPATPYTSSTSASTSSSRPQATKRPKSEKADENKTVPIESTYSLADEEVSVKGVENGTAAAAAAAGMATTATIDTPTEPVLYDVIWGQWCLQHLSDRDLVAFLKRCKACLVTAAATASPKSDLTSSRKSNAVLDGAGIIVVKENVLRDEEDGGENVWYDDEDHSITRTSNAYERVFREAGLEVVRTELQLGLPEELFPVRIWCLRVTV